MKNFTLNMLPVLLAACVLLESGNAFDETPLRIVTFNAEILTAPGIREGELQKYRWDTARAAQFERVAAVIEALNPDILNLVEVTSQEGVDYLVEILHEKGMTDYRGYHIDSHDKFTSMDVALISKLKPDRVEGQLIRNFYSKEEDPTWRQSYQSESRGSLRQYSTGISRHAVYLLTVGDYRLGFLGLHLKSNPSSGYANDRRTAQVEVAKRIIQQELVGRGYMPIVLGDFNDYDPDVPDRDETRDTMTNVLRSLKDFDSRQEGPELENVAKRMSRQADRYTSVWDRNENGVRDPFDVLTMIDHIFLPKELMPLVERVFIFHSITLETSDHHAVVVDLQLPWARRSRYMSIARMIDHAVLLPTQTEDDLRAACAMCVEHQVASVCVKPSMVLLASELLAGTGVAPSTVIGFPHGGTTTVCKVRETEIACQQGAREVDMVVNLGRVLAQDWQYVEEDIRQVVEAARSSGAISKVIFETGLLPEDSLKIRLCEICEAAGAGFVKTSTGFGYIKDADGTLRATGATEHDIRLMCEHTSDQVQVKASGGIRSYDDAQRFVAMGATRLGTSGTKAIVAGEKGQLAQSQEAY